jgi:hypothetical protein
VRSITSAVAVGTDPPPTIRTFPGSYIAAEPKARSPKRLDGPAAQDPAPDVVK